MNKKLLFSLTDVHAVGHCIYQFLSFLGVKFKNDVELFLINAQLQILNGRT